MWFIFVFAGLFLVVVCGLYVRRRLCAALSHFGAGERGLRILRWVIVWLLFGYPLLIIVSVLASVVLGRSTLPRFDGVVGSWLLGFPFAWAVLVVLQAMLWLLALDLAHWIVRKKRGAATAARVRAIGVLAVIGSFAVYTPLKIIIDRDELRVRSHQVGRAAGAAVPFRIAFIADIQQDEHTDVARARDVYERVNASLPDVVLSGGDWINTGPEHIEEAAVTASMLKSRLGTFSVRGDHEHFAYFDRHRSVAEVEAALRRHGIALLDNEVRWFDHHGKRIAVVFLSYNYIQRADPATIGKLVASVGSADYSIAITHQLDRRLAAQLENKIDLVLAGHTHGGQVNPVVGLTHVKLARLETPLIDGRYQLGTTTVIVTPGAGYSILPLRYAAPPAIELIELRL